MIEQRKSKRFELKLPLELVRTGAIPIGQIGETKNMSSSGVLFDADTSLEIGSSIEYFITLPATKSGGNEVRLRCMGKVIRQEPAGNAAATLDRYEFVRS